MAVRTRVLLSPPRRKRNRITTETVLKTTMLILGISMTLMPFIWLILGSFKTATELIQTPPTFWPENPTLENYRTILHDPKLPLLRFYGNSTFVAAFNVTTTLFTSSLFGFLFAKYEFRGKRILFGWVMLLLMIPGQITMIPSFLILAKLGLLNSLWGLVVFSAVDAFGIFMMKQFVESLPNELLDAARIDGASEWKIYLQIVLPQLGAPLATLGVLNFMGNWNAYLWPMVVITSIEKRTLPIILTWYNSQHSTNAGITNAATVLVVLPILFLFLYFQRWIVRGFTMSGLKG
ncbi:MAG: carbohydrate ABC transporter permease [Anaerolineae bacterium]|nr:carbohydrate ABC transporter permease [Anaerolineae bacterium]